MVAALGMTTSTGTRGCRDPAERPPEGHLVAVAVLTAGIRIDAVEPASEIEDEASRLAGGAGEGQ